MIRTIGSPQSISRGEPTYTSVSPGKGDPLEVVKRIIGEQNPLLLAKVESTQAVATRTVPGSHLSVCGMAIPRCAAGFTHKCGDFSGDGDDDKIRRVHARAPKFDISVCMSSCEPRHPILALQIYFVIAAPTPDQLRFLTLTSGEQTAQACANA